MSIGPADALVVAVAVFFFSSFVIQPKRVRQQIFFVLCGLGLAITTYGYLVMALTQRTGLFDVLGVWRSGLVVGIFIFAALTVDKLFNASQRRRYVYPAVAWYFTIWMLADIAIFAILTRDKNPVFATSPSWGLAWLRWPDVKRQYIILDLSLALFYLLVLMAFLIAASRRFQLTVFRKLLPVISIGVVFMLWQAYDVVLAGGRDCACVAPEGASEVGIRWARVARPAVLATTRDTTTTLQNVILGKAWGLVWVLGYIYLHLK